MTDSSTPEGTGYTVDSAAEAIGRLLGEDADSEATEALEEETPQSDEEDEAEEAEASDEDESEDDAESDEDAQEQPQTYAVKIDGEEVQVTLDEALRGYQREKDYTRKTQALAEERKALEPEKTALQAERAKTVELLKQLETVLQQPATDAEQMEWLKQNDPTGYAVALSENIQRHQQAQAAQAERLRMEQENAKEQAKAANQALQAEVAKLHAARPAWKDQARFDADLKVIRAYASDKGLTDAEIDGITDHRLVIALHDAALYRKLQTDKPQPKPKAPGVKTARPGVATGQQPKSVTDVTRAKQRLAKTGNVNDAAALFMHLIPD